MNIGSHNPFKPNVQKLLEKGNVRGLIRAIDHPDVLVSLDAARSLKKTILSASNRIPERKKSQSV